MTTDQQHGERISRWLEAEAPTQLPEHVLRATFERTRTTRQQAGWRAVLGRLTMNRLTFALGGAAATVVVAFLALSMYFGQPGPALPQPTPSPSPTAEPIAQPTSEVTAPPSPRPTPTSAPSPEERLFTSERHGYSLMLPDERWFVVEHGGSWKPGTVYQYDTNGVDRVLSFSEPDWLVLINSQSVPAEMAFEEWLDLYQAAQAAAWDCRAEDSETRAVSGRSAHLLTWVCPQDNKHLREAEALILGDGRVRSLSIRSESDDPILDLRVALDEWLARLELTD